MSDTVDGAERPGQLAGSRPRPRPPIPSSRRPGGHPTTPAAFAEVSDARAHDVLAAVTARFAAHLARGGAAPDLTLEWDHSGSAVPTVWWEEGPARWAVTAVGGSCDPDGTPQAPMRSTAGVVCEPFTPWALCIYPAQDPEAAERAP